MKEAPAFQLYASDFYVDTAGWTAAEVGAYLRLLLHQWVEGPLENKMSVLARIAGVDPRNMQKMWSTVIAKKFTTDNAGMLFNKRLENTRQELLNFRELQREKGMKGAAKRWNKPMTGALRGQSPKDGSSSSSSSSDIKDLKDIASKAFDAWWIKYPHRNGEKVTKAESQKYLSGIKFTAWDDLMLATENYAKSKRVLEGYAKDPIRFLKKGFWKDFLSVQAPTTQDDEAKALNERINKLREKQNGG